MNKISKISFLLFFIVLILSGCEEKTSHKEPLKISVSSWIGYTPLIHSYKMGYLKDTNIEIVPTSSIETSLEFIKRDVVEGFCSTQRGFNVVRELIDVTPIYLFDKSYGGDVILSNLPKNKLLSLKNTVIDVYMEVETVNYSMFKQFQEYYNLDNVKFNIINKAQNTINTADIQNNSIIVSYTPFSTQFQKNGFYTIDTSKNKIYRIIDGLFVKTSTIKDNKKTYTILTNSLNKSIYELRNNPKEFYEVVKKYIENQTYEEFTQAIKEIQFINGNKKEIFQYLKRYNIPTNEIMNETYKH